MPAPEPFHLRGFALAVSIIAFYRKIAARDDMPRHIATQVLRAGTAIGANLEEARSAYSRRDLAAKYTIALREARECHYWLRLIVADRPGMAPEVESLLDACHQIIAVLTVAVRKLRT